MRYIGIHHFGPTGSNPLAKTSTQTEQEINLAHKVRWPDFPSKLNSSFIGYNFIIWPDGTMKQFRYIGEETAAQKGHNFDTISICLAGNFTKGVEMPTIMQKMKLKGVLKEFLANQETYFSKIEHKVYPGTKFDLSKDRIHPHRILQPNHTDCYGSVLSDKWAQELITEITPTTPPIETNEKQVLMEKIASLLRQVGQLLQALLNKKKQLGSFGQCLDDVRG